MNIFNLIRLSAFLALIGRAYQFYFFGAPFRAFLWDESLLTPIVEGIFNMSWFDYATSEKVNKGINLFTKISAIILFLGALISLFWNQIQSVKLKKFVLGISVFILLFMAICLVKDKNYDILQFFEQAIQITAPLVLLFSKNNEINLSPKLLLGLKIAIGLTFIPHGLFALGFPYLPGHFIDMTINILGVTESQARLFLAHIGVLDIIAVILMFFPRFAKYAFIYIIAWGIATALARIVAGFSLDFFFRSIHNNAYLTVYRLPHGLLPLAVYIIMFQHIKIPFYSKIIKQ